MNNLPPFLTPVFASLEPIYKKAMEYETSDLGPKELFTKIASDVGPMADPAKELIAISTNFRNMFKEAALKAGKDETYVRGAFDEAETICKLGIADMIQKTAVNWFQNTDPDGDQTSTTEMFPHAGELPHVVQPPTVNLPPLDPNAPINISSNPITGLNAKMFNKPMGTEGGPLGQTPPMTAYIPPDSGGAGTQILPTGQAPNSPPPSQPPGWMGMLGGGVLAALLAKQMGLGGMTGMAATLLGAYGGHHYLPQIMDYVQRHGGLGNLINQGRDWVSSKFNPGAAPTATTWANDTSPGAIGAASTANALKAAPPVSIEQ